MTENKEILLEITKENRKNRNNRLKTKGPCDELCTGVWPAKWERNKKLGRASLISVMSLVVKLPHRFVHYLQAINCVNVYLLLW